MFQHVNFILVDHFFSRDIGHLDLPLILEAVPSLFSSRQPHIVAGLTNDSLNLARAIIEQSSCL